MNLRIYCMSHSKEVQEECFFLDQILVVCVATEYLLCEVLCKVNGMKGFIPNQQYHQHVNLSSGERNSLYFGINYTFYVLHCVF